jgi:hypothetical protein
MKKRILGVASALTVVTTNVIAGTVAYVAPVEAVIVEETDRMAGSGLWLIPLLAIALMLLLTQSGSNNNQSSPSDRRIKRDIKEVGMTANGLPLYEFRYIFGRKRYVGVMAQDVLMHTPEAVVRSLLGYFKVNYRMLGIEMKSVH